jgi:acetyltransferase
MWQYSANLRGLYETPTLPQNSPDDTSARATAEKIIDTARSAGRDLLTEYESKQLLAAYGIPTVETRIATTAQEAVQCADEIGYPVVLKLHSLTITHKTDVGGVLLNWPMPMRYAAPFSPSKLRCVNVPVPPISRV